MCDFLISSQKKYKGKHLLELLKAPYGERAPQGKSFDFKWGSIAILEERLARNNNIYTIDDTVFAWVGDLITDLSVTAAEEFIHCVADISKYQSKESNFLMRDSLFEKLNGAFAILIAHADGFSIITDPMNFTPVYAGMNTQSNIVSLGTHPDLVACISRNDICVDEVSVAEYLSYGCSTFPNTMHSNVKEINPGRLHINNTKNRKICPKEYVYWLPPQEVSENYNENALAEELCSAFSSAIKDRCNNKKVTVLLSGGLDSRLIMALVPENVDCIGLTFSDSFNREAKTAKKVAECYNRKWFNLPRDREFVGNNMVGIVKLLGCECEWISAHAYGFAEKISDFDVDCLLSGQMFDSYLKGILALDFVIKKSLHGLLPPHYEKRIFDYVHQADDSLRDVDTKFWNTTLSQDVLDNVYERRREYYEANHERKHRSVELLFLYPFSQFMDTANWFGDRKLLPVQLVGFDRRLLDFAFKCPVELKLDNKIFLMAAMKIYGPGARIKCVNDGVRPGSSHISRLAQRAIRKTQDIIIRFYEKLSKTSKFQHSWSDYQKYWSQSSKLKSLINEYGANLGQFDGCLFNNCGKDLLKSDNIHWRNGFRLLQVAVWKGIIEDYRKQLKKITK
jgi:asparagine synthetase B (glutamine-hydrolysing)